MILLRGLDLVLPDRIAGSAALLIDHDRIVEILDASRSVGSAATLDLSGHVAVPGFIDVHVHGVAGDDTLGGGDSLRRIAAALPAYGVTAFCPTTVACSAENLRAVLRSVAECRTSPSGRSARVLPAHLESNFINPAFAGAQPLDLLFPPPAFDGPGTHDDGGRILAEIAAGAADVGIVTLAPELQHAPSLIRWLCDRGIRVSLGHSGATYDEASSAIAAGARHATHLFNRMLPLHHREPGLAGAVLSSEDVAAEVICDGFHVHPAMVRAAVAAKQPSRMMAVTDASAAAGLPAGACALLGGRRITARPEAAFLDDGTLAGSVCTMDRTFRVLTSAVGLSLVDAVLMCSTTPARELGLQGFGVIAPGAVADLVVLDRELSVVQTYIGGELVYARS